MKKNLCNVPFEEACITFDGDVYFCCQSYLKNPPYIWGNLNSKSFEEIWNGDEAKSFRRRMLNGDYSLCNIEETCNKTANTDAQYVATLEGSIEYKEEMPLPRLVSLCVGSGCNIACQTCRNKVFNGNDPNFMKKMDEWYLPALKNAQQVYFNGAGEPFVDTASRVLIKKIAEEHPHIKFHIHTNGSLCDKKHCDELGITDKLVTVTLSLHATTAETHAEFTRSKTFNSIIKNLEWLKILKDQGKLQKIILVFVVNAVNYKEMAAFIYLAKSFEAEANFWNYRRWNDDFTTFNRLNVLSPNHPGHLDFVRMITGNDAVAAFTKKENKVHLNPILLKFSQLKNPDDYILSTIQIVRMIKEDEAAKEVKVCEVGKLRSYFRRIALKFQLTKYRVLYILTLGKLKKRYKDEKKIKSALKK
jgi:sulfatase maturation enzyme AslB (radical SAM superfamily)